MDSVSVRELRNQGGQILDRVQRGESLVVTRDGEPIAELRPLPRQPLPKEEVLRRFENLPPIDPGKFRTDLDAVIDPRLFPDESDG
jgi:prevent-host-death family protein